MFLVNLAVGFVLVPVVGFYLLRDWDLLVERVSTLVPRGAAPTVARLARESDQVLGAFLRGQLSVMIALGAIYGIGLWLVGIDVGPLIGMIAGLISFVPFLGAIVGVVMALIAALVQYHDWLHVILVAVVFAVGQTLEGYVLVPKLVGDRIGLHPVAVIFAVLAGGELFGFIGVLVALPVAAVAMVLLRYAHERYRQSAMYRSGAEPRIVTASAVADADEEVTVVVTRAEPEPGQTTDASAPDSA
jgi:predicted PurR-regulated permease PerM